MMKVIGRFLNKIFNVFGYHLSHKHKIIPATFDKNWGERLNINTILDIGANEGQFILEINSILPNRKIYAFEPIPDCYKKLVQKTGKLDVTCFNFGLSDINGNIEINISNNLVSSSILKMEELHKKNYPNSEFVKKQDIQIKRLDDVLPDLDIKENFLIKVDVQGYENKVILGGKKTFELASAIIIESSFAMLYNDQWLFDDIYQHFINSGFKFMGFTDQENSKKSGIPLFADSIFIRKDLVHLVN